MAAETSVYPSFSVKDGSKLIYISRKEKLGREECSYGESGIKSICRASAEDGISFSIIDKDISYFKNSPLGQTQGKTVTIGKEQSFVIQYGAEGYNTEHYYIPLDVDSTLVITVDSTYDWGSRVSSPSRELVDQILSTFRFAE